MRKPFIGANWKMNLLNRDARSFLQHLQNFAPLNAQKEIVVFPSMVYLSALSEHFNHLLGAQNVSHIKGFSSLTGETSIEQLIDLGIGYVLIGHSERREYYFESNEIISQKINTVLNKNLKVVFCCGESLDVRNEGRHFEWVETQLNCLLNQSPSLDSEQIVIAYEPIWAIGTGKTPTYDEINDIHAYIRSLIRNHSGEQVSSKIRIVYGGSCNESNANEIFSLPDVDGGLIGGASLEWNSFFNICNAL